MTKTYVYLTMHTIYKFLIICGQSLPKYRKWLLRICTGKYIQSSGQYWLREQNISYTVFNSDDSLLAILVRNFKSEYCPIAIDAVSHLLLLPLPHLSGNETSGYLYLENELLTKWNWVRCPRSLRSLRILFQRNDYPPISYLDFTFVLLVRWNRY